MAKAKRFNTEKNIADGTAVKDAPLVGGEFITEEGDWQGQTVQVQSDKHLEDDLGTGDPVILRTFVFGVNPEAFGRRTPTSQELFDDHKRGISAMLWQDGLTPMEEVEPRVYLSRDKTKYFITVGAKPQMGQSIIDTTQTLSQIVNGTSTDSDSLYRKL